MNTKLISDALGSNSAFARCCDLVKKVWRAWNRFWFEADSAAQMRVFRFCLGVLLLILYTIRTIDLDFFYSDHGLWKSAVIQELLPMKYRFSIFFLMPGEVFLWIANGVFLLALATLTLGIYPRISAIIVSIIHISFQHRNISAHYGVDMIATFFFLYLCFADYRDPVRRPKGVFKQDVQSILGSVAFRFCQIQLCIIYGYSGLHKLKGVYWWKGEGIWAVLANAQMARWDFSFLSHFPAILTVASFISLFWEVYFPALIWVKKLRYPMLVFGVLFHLGIGILISIPFFGLLMIVGYIPFIDAAHCRQIEGFFRKLHIPIQVPRIAAEE